MRGRIGEDLVGPAVQANARVGVHVYDTFTWSGTEIVSKGDTGSGCSVFRPNIEWYFARGVARNDVGVPVLCRSFLGLRVRKWEPEGLKWFKLMLSRVLDRRFVTTTGLFG